MPMRTATKRPGAGKSRSRPSHASAVEVAVQFATRSRPLPSAGEFRRWVRAACPQNARLTLRIVGEAEGRALNRDYRGRDYATNVLTFVLRGEPPYEGDVALCAPVVTREARAQAKRVKAHYAHLTVHGVLHLQGYEHESDADARKMERLETRILKRLGYSNPYASRPHGRPAQ